MGRDKLHLASNKYKIRLNTILQSIIKILDKFLYGSEDMK